MVEIRNQLQRLCQRANRFSTVRALAAIGIAILAFATAVVVAAARLSPQGFRPVAWLAVVATLTVATAVLVLLKRDWLDPFAAAALADRRAHLQERLVTLMALPSVPHDRVLAPVLIAQIIEMRGQWRPELLLPRRVPRSVYLLSLATLLFCATVWHERQVPQPEEPSRSAIPSPIAKNAESDRSAATEVAAESGPRAGEQVRRTEISRSKDEETESEAETESEDGAAGLPDQLQHAIQAALSRDQTNASRKRSQAPDGASADSTLAGRPRQSAGEIKPGGASANSPTQKDGDDAQQRAAARANQLGEPMKRDAMEGEPPPASSMAAAGKLMGKSASGVAGAQAEPFKLTLTSFMASVPSTIPQPQMRGSMPTDVAAAKEWALSDQHFDDDLLHRADVPVAYESVIRRAYARDAEADTSAPQK